MLLTFGCYTIEFLAFQNDKTTEYIFIELCKNLCIKDSFEKLFFVVKAILISKLSTSLLRTFNIFLFKVDKNMSMLTYDQNHQIS